MNKFKDLGNLVSLLQQLQTTNLVVFTFDYSHLVGTGNGPRQ